MCVRALQLAAVLLAPDHRTHARTQATYPTPVLDPVTTTTFLCGPPLTKPQASGDSGTAIVPRFHMTAAAAVTATAENIALIPMGRL